MFDSKGEENTVNAMTDLFSGGFPGGRMKLRLTLSRRTEETEIGRSLGRVTV